MNLRALLEALAGRLAALRALLRRIDADEAARPRTCPRCHREKPADQFEDWLGRTLECADCRADRDR